MGEMNRILSSANIDREKTEIELINRMLIMATEYGGDDGGAYFNRLKPNLIDRVNAYIQFRGWSDFYEAKEVSNFILIAEK